MSWQDYVNAYLVNWTDQNTGKSAFNICDSGAIIGNQDGTVWASTPGFALKTEQVDVDKEDGVGTEKVNVVEFNSLKDAFDGETFGRTSQKGGIRINGEKYFAVSQDPDTKIIYLKKAGGGAAIAKSNLAFVIGIFDVSKKMKNLNGNEEVQNPGMTNRVVEELQKFLLANNL
jgi:hypothetical protein